MKRRSLLGGLAGILATGFAPAAVSSAILMPTRRIALPTDSARQAALDAIMTRKPGGTVSKLLDVSDGISTNYIDTRFLVIKDKDGNVIFSTSYDGNYAEFHRPSHLKAELPGKKWASWIEHRN